MAVKKWSAKKQQRLRREYPGCADPRLLAKNLKVSYKALKSKATVLGLKRKFTANVGRTKCTAAQDKFLKANYLKMGKKTMGRKLGISDTLVYGRLRQLGLKVPKKLAEKFKREGMYRKGSVPANKGKKQTEYMTPEGIAKTIATRFNGNPHNTLFDGAITIRHDHPGRGGKPHKYIRISSGKWKELQIYNWEKKKGPVPKGYILACKDGDTLNCRPSNWHPLSKADNARRNSGSINLPDGYVAHLIAGKKMRHLKEEFLKRPDLIDLKRQNVILKRSIDEKRGNKKLVKRNA